MTTPPSHRWLRFVVCLGTLLFVLSVFVYWIGYQVYWVRERRAALESIYASAIKPGPPEKATWLMRIYGERPILVIDLAQRAGQTQADLESQVELLKDFFPETEIAYYDADGQRVVTPPRFKRLAP